MEFLNHFCGALEHGFKTTSYKYKPTLPNKFKCGLNVTLARTVFLLQEVYSRRRRRTGPTRVPTCTQTSQPRPLLTRWDTTTIRGRARPSATIRAFHRTWPATHITRHHDRRTCTGPPGRCRPARPRRSGRLSRPTSTSNEQDREIRCRRVSPSPRSPPSSSFDVHRRPLLVLSTFTALWPSSSRGRRRPICSPSKLRYLFQLLTEFFLLFLDSVQEKPMKFRVQQHYCV